MALYPGHKYLGPGNPLNNGTPVDSADRIAEKHDWAYHFASSAEDIFSADAIAIKEFFKDSVSSFSLPSLVGAVGLSVKTGVEHIVGSPLYPSMPSGTKRPASGSAPLASSTPKKSLFSADSTTGNTDFNTVSSSDFVTMDEGQSEEQPMADDPGTRESGGGGGKGSVGGSGNVSFVQAPMVQTPNYSTLTFTKTYRFSNLTRLPSYKWVKGSSTGTAFNNDFEHNNIIYRPGSMNLIPVHHIWAYLSPQEYKHIQDSYQYACVENVGVIVNSYGIRLPYQTGQNVAVTANASSQYPITQWIGLDKDQPIRYDNESLNKIRKQMIGANINEYAIAPDFTEVFKNLTARATSREFKCPCEIVIPMPLYGVPIEGNAVMWQNNNANVFGEIGTNQYAHSKNGTTSLGPVFQYSYKPKNGMIHCIATNQRRQGNATSFNSMRVLLEGNTTRLGNPMAGNVVDGTFGDANFEFNFNDWIPAEMQPYEQCLIENQHQFHPTEHQNTKRQPFFIVGNEILRNDDDSLLKAVWEFSLQYTITIRCKTGTKGQYGLKDTIMSQYMHPHMQIGSYGKYGSSQKWNEYVDRGWVAVPFKDVETGNHQPGFFNKTPLRILRRTDGDINQVRDRAANENSWRPNNSYRQPSKMYRMDDNQVFSDKDFSYEDAQLREEAERDKGIAMDTRMGYWLRSQSANARNFRAPASEPQQQQQQQQRKSQLTAEEADLVGDNPAKDKRRR